MKNKPIKTKNKLKDSRKHKKEEKYIYPYCTINKLHIKYII